MHRFDSVLTINGVSMTILSIVLLWYQFDNDNIMFSTSFLDLQISLGDIYTVFSN